MVVSLLRLDMLSRAEPFDSGQYCYGETLPPAFLGHVFMRKSTSKDDAIYTLDDSELQDVSIPSHFSNVSKR